MSTTIGSTVKFDIKYIESYFKTFPDKIPLRCWCDALIQQQNPYGLYLLNLIKNLKSQSSIFKMKDNAIDAILHESKPKQVTISLPDSNIVAMGQHGNRLETLLKENRFVIVSENLDENCGYIIIPNQLRYFEIQEFGSSCMYLEIKKAKEVSLKEIIRSHDDWFYKKLITVMSTY